MIERKRLTLLGTKDFAQQIREFAVETGEFEFVGYYDNLETKGELVNGFPVLGTLEDAIGDYAQGLFDCIFICVGYTRFDLREQFYNALKGRVPLATIMMPGVSIGKGAQVGEGVFVGEGSRISERTVIEDNVVILKENFIAHDNLVKKHTYIAGRVQTAGFVTIGERCFVGIACLFADHISVCDDVWLSLGSIVARKIKKPGKYVSPAIKLVNIG